MEVKFGSLSRSASSTAWQDHRFFARSVQHERDAAMLELCRSLRPVLGDSASSWSSAGSTSSFVAPNENTRLRTYDDRRGFSTGRLLAPTPSTPWLAEPPPPSLEELPVLEPAAPRRQLPTLEHRARDPTDWRDHMRPWLPERRAKHGTAARSIPGSGAAPAPRPRNAYYAQLHPKPPPPDAWRRYNFGELSRGR